MESGVVFPDPDLNGENEVVAYHLLAIFRDAMNSNSQLADLLGTAQAPWLTRLGQRARPRAHSAKKHLLATEFKNGTELTACIKKAWSKRASYLKSSLKPTG
jgi:hypothetical protein